MARRRFLAGAGVVLGLPLLETFAPKKASGQTVTQPPFLLLVVQGNGVVQAGRAIDGSTDPEQFWPTQTGALTVDGLEADRATRAAGELSAHAARLAFYRGLSHPFESTGCSHASGDAQILTAATLSGSSNRVLATGESIDSVIARELNPGGREPLVLHAGKYSPGGTGFDIPGYVSYVGANQPRTYLDSPYTAYQRMIGVVGTGAPEEPVPAGPTPEQELLAARSKSVNDLLRSEIQELLALPELSTSDRQRLEQHFSAIRDLEVAMGGGAPAGVAVPQFSEATIAEMERVGENPYDMTDHEALIRLHLSLMVFGVASGYTRVAVLKIGDREDDHEFTLGGSTFVYHTASHRGVPDGLALCSRIDRIHLQIFKEFLDQLAAVETPSGPLIDAGVTVWTNQVGNGAHSFQNIPWILAGSAGGFLRTGHFADVGDRSYQTNRMLNTLASAAGVRTAEGAPLSDFGDPDLAPGVVDEAIA